MDFRYFIFEYGGGFIRDSVNDKILGFEGICNRLNEQQKMIDDLKEENEQLKQEVFVYKKAFQEQVQRCTL